MPKLVAVCLVLLSAIVMTSGCTTDTPVTPSPSLDGTPPAILVGRLLPASPSDARDLDGAVNVIDGCAVLAGSSIEDTNLPIVWPIGTAIADTDINEIVMLNGSIRVGEKIAPAQGWLTTVGEFPPETVTGLDADCIRGPETKVIVLSAIRGMPTQE